MESGYYEFDSLSELPPLPPVFDPMEYSRNFSSFEPLPPFPSSDFISTPFFSDHHHHQDLLHLQQHVPDSFFLDSSLSVLTRHNIAESTRLENLFHGVFSDEATPFLHLPDLKSFEQIKTDAVENTKPPFLCLSPPPPVEKRRRLSTFNISPTPSSSSNSGSSAPAASSYTVDGGDRRRNISDKIRSLEKLMPWEKKMSLATILEETHKYITFLQAQIAALRWMPLESVYCTGDERTTDLLKSLTRQQILQVLANSPGARTELYTRGVCVFSYEQLLSLKMMSQSARNLWKQHIWPAIEEHELPYILSFRSSSVFFFFGVKDHRSYTERFNGGEIRVWYIKPLFLISGFNHHLSQILYKKYRIDWISNET